MTGFNPQVTNLGTYHEFNGVRHEISYTDGLGVKHPVTVVAIDQNDTIVINDGGVRLRPTIIQGYYSDVFINPINYRTKDNQFLSELKWSRIDKAIEDGTLDQIYAYNAESYLTINKPVVWINNLLVPITWLNIWRYPVQWDLFQLVKTVRWINNRLNPLYQVVTWVNNNLTAVIMERYYQDAYTRIFHYTATANGETWKYTITVEKEYSVGKYQVLKHINKPTYDTYVRPWQTNNNDTTSWGSGTDQVDWIN